MDNYSLYKIIESINNDQISLKNSLNLPNNINNYNNYNTYNNLIKISYKNDIINKKIKYFENNQYINNNYNNINTKINSHLKINYLRKYSISNLNNKPELPYQCYLKYIKKTKYKNIYNPINFQCPISQIYFNENSDIIQLKICNHIFLEKNITKWLEYNNTCPLCRLNISNIK